MVSSRSLSSSAFLRPAHTTSMGMDRRGALVFGLDFPFNASSCAQLIGKHEKDPRMSGVFCFGYCAGAPASAAALGSKKKPSLAWGVGEATPTRQMRGKAR